MLHCSRLASSRLRASSQFDPAQPLAAHHHYLVAWSPVDFLDGHWVSKFTELEIDTCGSGFKSKVHVCPQLALKIPYLRSVRLRIHKICPRIFDALQQNDGATSSRIESIIVNLSLKETDCFPAGFSSHCTQPKRVWELYDDIVVTATEIGKQNPSFKVLRILCHKHPSLQIVARDCIAGTKMVLCDQNA